MVKMEKKPQSKLPAVSIFGRMGIFGSSGHWGGKGEVVMVDEWVTCSTCREK